jgi:hypothetical protein
MQQSVA